MYPLDVEGHDANTVVERLRTVDRDARHVFEPRQDVASKEELMLVDLVHADRLEVVDRCAEPDRIHVRRRAGLELPRQLVPRRLLDAPLHDHVTAVEEGTPAP